MQGNRMRGESAKQVAIDVLRAAGEPLHMKEITKRVIESGRSSDRREVGLRRALAKPAGRSPDEDDDDRFVGRQS